jgi:DNA-binding GntR family transcriptional regulator
VAVPKLSDDDLTHMREINAAMLKAAGERSDSFVSLNRQFHFVPFERTGSDHLIRFLRHLWDAAARYQNAMAYVRVPRSTLHDHHNSLMKAFEARDVDEVNLWMAKHRQVTLEAIRKLHSSAGTGRKKSSSAKR